MARLVVHGHGLTSQQPCVRIPDSPHRCPTGYLTTTLRPDPPGHHHFASAAIAVGFLLGSHHAVGFGAIFQRFSLAAPGVEGGGGSLGGGVVVTCEATYMLARQFAADLDAVAIDFADRFELWRRLRRARQARNDA